MPSQLTRRVFRSIVANEPMIFSGCLRRRPQAGMAPLSRKRRSSPLHIGQSQRRNFFNFDLFRRAAKDVIEPELDPGVDTMFTYAKMERLRARLPPVEDVVEAFTRFFEYKLKKGQSIEDTHAELALKSLRYCFAHGGSRDLDAEDQVGFSTLVTAIKVLSQTPRQPTAAHANLASTVYTELMRHGPGADKWYPAVFNAYTKILCDAGRIEEARELLLKRTAEKGSPEESDDIESEMNANADGAASSKQMKNRRGFIVPWRHVIKGFVKASDKDELMKTWELMNQQGMPLNKALICPMVEFYCGREDAAAVKHWWTIYSGLIRPDHPTGQEMDGNAASQVFRWCLRHDHLDFGHAAVRDLMQTNPSKPVWDAIFVWAAGTKKSADEIGRMFDVMEQSNTSLSDASVHRHADIYTINGLVDFAISQEDPYMAERFINLGRDRGILPNARTFVLQIEYRLTVGDVDGALVAYKNLQAEDLSENDDLPAVNKLLVALCTSKRHDFDTVMAVAADLSDRRTRFEPRTVSTLCVLHLSRNETHDTVDLLNTHAVHYSSAERAIVRDTLLSYCLSPETSTAASWDAYNILKTIFDELPRSDRARLMSSYFSPSRSRPDMAVHIFNHMRSHTRPDTIPTTETYVAAFMGSARLRDLESLEVVHNQLKLDFNISLTTYVYNALILAYTACGRPRQALDFWDDIVASREGPTYNSIHIALRACEKAPFGDLKAQEIWERLKRNGVEIDHSMWASYAGALAGNGDTGLAVQILEQAEEKGEVALDAFVLGSLFAGAPGQNKQMEIEEWVKSTRATVWRELVEEIGVVVREDEMRYFRIDRAVAP